MKIGIICYRYSLEISSLIKNISTYLSDKNNQVDIFVDKLFVDSKFKFLSENIRIIFPEKKIIFETLLSDEKKISVLKKYYIKGIKNKRNNYDLIFAVDFSALDILKKTKANFNKIIALMLEGFNYCMNFNSKYIRNILISCKKIIFTDKDRAEDFFNLLGFELNNIEYLPVSVRTKNIVRKTESNSELINLLYSGYFADWACVHEIVNLFKSCEVQNIKLTLHGHSMGTEYYLEEAHRLCMNDANILFDKSFYDDEKYCSFLSKYDIGIAFYKDINNDGNFSNIILSSGKIAAYLSAGLAVITNLDNEITSKPPFLLVKDFSKYAFLEKIEYYKRNKSSFIQSAYELVDNFYNFDKYMDKIIDNLIS
jgi:hypothetical protein